MSILKKFTKTVLTGAVASLMLSPLAMAATINIGYTGPLSGGAALYGKDALDGLTIAADEINANGGIDVAGKNYDIKIVSYDDEYAPSKAAMNARRLAQSNKASIIFTPHSGGIFALQAFNEASDFVLMGYSSLPSLTEQGNTLNLRLPPLFTSYIDPFIDFTMERFGNKLAIANATHDYAKAWTKEFVPAWKAKGGEIVADNPMDYNRSADFYTGVSRSLNAKPDVMFIGGASEPTGLVVKQARELGFKGAFIMMDQAKLVEVAEVAGGMKALEGSVGLPPLSIYDTEAAQRLIKLYKETNAKREPTTEVGMQYFAMHLAAEAMKAAGSVNDAKKIRAAFDEALVNLPEKYNVYDIKYIDEKGGLVGDVRYATVENGEMKPIIIKAEEQ